jgi:hypothetical protein
MNLAAQFTNNQKFLVPTCDLQAGLIVLGEDLGIP